eukprot:TRINITY_DN11152_c0_g1_i7.p1 TRINITY_DN11152_c0_g1~~TRINITY_DN11152_c0_g1_i7.p1  ORF type:complete len:163 (+),score=19.84 TRINITY_DN11152_c0_g1_i7:466-954(+)
MNLPSHPLELELLDKLFQISDQPPSSSARRVRGEKQPSATEACLNVLLMHARLQGTIGMAFRGSYSPGTFGGICERRLLPKAGGYQATNTVMVSTMRSNNQLMTESQRVALLAHEIGHSFGGSHACTCTPGGEWDRNDGLHLRCLNPGRRAFASFADGPHWF